MANFQVSETYDDVIKKLEPTTPGHADNFNEIFQKLINNDAFIKKVAEQQLAIMQSHISNADDPHQEVFQTYYQQLVSYTDKAVADLINGAPETADTLRELADLIDKNKDVATALNEAIGKKANQTELDQAVSDISSLNRTLKNKITGQSNNIVIYGGTWLLHGVSNQIYTNVIDISDLGLSNIISVIAQPGTYPSFIHVTVSVVSAKSLNVHTFKDATGNFYAHFIIIGAK